MGYDATITFGSLTIEASDIQLQLVAGTRKQIVGGLVVVRPIPDRGSKDFRGTIRGSFSKTTRNADRDTLQTMFDNNNLVTLADGLHDGDYYILNLVWHDSHTRPTEHQFTLSIIQEQ